MGTNTILILIICSFHKNKHGTDAIPESTNYDRSTTILPKLNTSFADLLLKKRREIYNLLRGGKIIWHNIDENTYPYNKENLVLSEDFGAENNTATRFLPALHRYNGRFFKELGENGRANLSDPSVHVLILSGLYGFVTPTELIQLYSVPIEWGSPVQKVWKDENALTQILTDYIEQNHITQIFDCTARQDYRETIDWSYVQKFTDVRHCFSKLGAGNDALEDYARFFREQAPGRLAEALMNLDFDKDPAINLKDYLYTRSLPEEWKGFPLERKSIPLEKGVLNLDAIPDYPTRQVFLTAEQMLKVIYNLETVGEDAGSIFFVLYGKGLEVMLENAVTKKIRTMILKKYPEGNIPEIRSLPKSLTEVLDPVSPRSIPLGSWDRLTNDCTHCNHPVTHMVLQWITATYGTQFSVITSTAKQIAEMRNPGAHNKIQTIDDFLDERKRIIDRINRIIPLLYPPLISE